MSYIGCKVTKWTSPTEKTCGLVDRESATSIWVGDLRLVHRGSRWHRYGDRDDWYEVETPEVRDYSRRRELVDRVVHRLWQTPMDKLEALVARMLEVAR